MTRFITHWTLAAAAAGLMTLPAAALAQTTSSSQPPAQPAASQTAAASARDQSATQSVTPADHVREAKQALDSIPKSSIPSADRAKVAQLKTHLDKLGRDVANQSAASAQPSAKAGSAAWATDAAAIDKLVGELERPESAAVAPTGTTGSASATSAQTAKLDDQAVAALDQVRQHVTAIASEMSGTAPSAANQNQATASSSTSSPDTMATPPSSASAASSAAPASSASPASSANPTQSTTTPQSPATGSQTSTPPAPTGTQSSVTQPPAGASQQSASAAAQPAGQQPAGDQANESAAKQHLTEARDTLSSITTMPEAAKLQGSARTDVSQLISDFNELITTQVNWRDSDQKVEADLTKLLGSQNGTTGTTGNAAASATGTTGTSNPPPPVAGQPEAATGNPQVEPAIRAKLVEFRAHLNEFEQAAGGAGSATSPEANAASPAASPSSAAMPSSTASPSNPSAPSNPASAANPSSSMNPTNPATSSAASAAASGTAGATGTTGSTAPSATGTTGTTPAASASDAGNATSLANHTEVERHLAAIQNLLSQAKDGKLDKSQTDQLKSEIAQLQQLLGGSK